MNVYPPTTGNAYARKVLDMFLPVPELGWRLNADAYLAWLAPLAGEVFSFIEPLGDFRLHGANSWKTAVVVTPQRLKKELQLLLDIQALLKSRATEFGLRLADDWLLGTPASLKIRLVYLLNAERRDLLPNDTRRSVTIEALGSVWQFSRYSLFKKVMYSAWFLSVGILSRSLTGYLQRVGVNPRGRSAVMSSIAARS